VSEIDRLLDFREKWVELETNLNPFALVVTTHLEAQAAATEAERLRAKLNLIRRLYGRGHERKDLIHLFRFIDWILALPPELEKEARRQVAELQGGILMPYVTSFERLAKEEGKAEGRAEGKAEGLREGLLEAIDLGLELRFGKDALRVSAASSLTSRSWTSCAR
jgi:hypothetical protein